jgi:hypothetical protein
MGYEGVGVDYYVLGEKGRASEYFSKDLASFMRK